MPNRRRVTNNLPGNKQITAMLNGKPDEIMQRLLNDNRKRPKKHKDRK